MRDTDIRVLRTTEELRAFVPAWKRLWQKDPQAKPFQRPEWLIPWWHHFGQAELRVIVIGQGSEPTGFLPFYVYPNPHTGERQLLLLGAGTSDYLDDIFAPSCPIDHIQHALELLRSEADWEILSATQLPLASKLAQAFRRLAPGAVQTFPGESTSRMPSVPIAQLPRKIRRNSMYYRNRAQRLGSLELQMANARDWPEIFDALKRLHTARWQARGEAGVLADASVLAWHREALPMLERVGCLRLCALRLNTEVIGVLYSLIDPPFRTERTQYFYLTAYSLQHAELRPGTLLLAAAIEAATAEGVQTIDMLRGDEDYKQLWHLERTATCGFALHSASATAQVLQTAGMHA